jgi:hypothetical protein
LRWQCSSNENRALPRAKRYAKRVGIAGAIIGFLPLGFRAILLAGDYFVNSPDSTDLGEMITWTTVMLFGAGLGAIVNRMRTKPVSTSSV